MVIIKSSIGSFLLLDVLDSSKLFPVLFSVLFDVFWAILLLVLLVWLVVFNVLVNFLFGIKRIFLV